MPNLLNNSQISSATGKMIDHFDTFSNGRTVVVYKESQKAMPTTQHANSMFGYGPNQPHNNFTYTEVKQEFPAIIRHLKEQTNELLEVDVRHPEAEVSIKVRQDARDYIENGRTDKFTFDDASWTIVSGPKKKLFLTLPFYYYELKKIA